MISSFVLVKLAVVDDVYGLALAALQRHGLDQLDLGVLRQDTDISRKVSM